jgi:hypothetical protein
MPRRKRIDPIRHWTIVPFILCAVILNVVILSFAARFGIVLAVQTLRDMKMAGAVIALFVMVELMLWAQFLDQLQEWRDKLAAKRNDRKDSL